MLPAGNGADMKESNICNLGKYSITIDCFKGILTLQMILAHCLQFYADLEVEKGWLLLTEYINLTTFSGFVFAFGYASYSAYIQKDFTIGVKKIIKNVLRLIIAFYISSFTYVIFIEGISFRKDRILDILLIKRLAGWSEFLIAFAGVLLITIPLIRLLRHKNEKLLILPAVFSILACMVTARDRNPLIGIFVGGYGNAYYPVIPYYLYFIIGIYFARKEIKFHWLVLLTAFMGTGYTAYTYFFVTKGWPLRFPLSLAWLTGAMLFLYGYYLLSDYLSCKRYFHWIAAIGKYSLYYLLFSNLIIFSIKRSIFYRLSIAYSIGLFVIILFVIWYLISLIKGKNAAALSKR